MIKRLLPLLALAALLAACAGGGRNPEPRGALVDPAQPQPVVTTEERVATMVPQADLPARPGVTPTSRAIDEQAQETAIANLRALLDDPQLELAFQSVDRSPNATNYPVFVFVDPLGSSYYVSQDSLLPVEFTQNRPPDEKVDPAIPPESLRARAAQIASTHSKRFAALRDQMTYVEGIKGQNNFFRWELPNSDVGGMPAILQIALREDGSLFGYLNSIDLE